MRVSELRGKSETRRGSSKKKNRRRNKIKNAPPARPQSSEVASSSPSFIVVSHFCYLQLPSGSIRLAVDVALEEEHRGYQRRRRQQQQQQQQQQSGRSSSSSTAINADTAAAATDLLFSFFDSLDPFRPSLGRLAGRHGPRFPGGPHSAEAAAARGVGGEHGPLRRGRRRLLRVEGGGGCSSGRGGRGDDGDGSSSSSSSSRRQQSCRRRRRSGHRRGEDAQARADRERSDPVSRRFFFLSSEGKEEERSFFLAFPPSVTSKLKTRQKIKNQRRRALWLPRGPVLGPPAGLRCRPRRAGAGRGLSARRGGDGSCLWPRRPARGLPCLGAPPVVAAGGRPRGRGRHPGCCGTEGASGLPAGGEERGGEERRKRGRRDKVGEDGGGGVAIFSEVEFGSSFLFLVCCRNDSRGRRAPRVEPDQQEQIRGETKKL